MKRPLLIALFFSATFLQAGPYELTFVLPPLFAGFNGNEADVGNTLALTAISTLFIVMFSGHVTERLGRMPEGQAGRRAPPPHRLMPHRATCRCANGGGIKTVSGKTVSGKTISGKGGGHGAGCPKGGLWMVQHHGARQQCPSTP